MTVGRIGRSSIRGVACGVGGPFLKKTARKKAAKITSAAAVQSADSFFMSGVLPKAEPPCIVLPEKTPQEVTS